MRIAHVIPDFSLGGIPKGGCVLADAMARAGHTCVVIGPTRGPRYREAAGPAIHLLAGSKDPVALAAGVREVAPEVVHIHRDAYQPQLIDLLSSHDPAPLVVSTPVFGRVPDDAGLLERTRTCHVGVYTFYRFCRWAGLSHETAARERGIGYVPITPFEPPNPSRSANDPQEVIADRRSKLGIPPDAFVAGRIGRDDLAKWRPENRPLIASLLEGQPRLHWLSIGLPAALGRDDLARRFAGRFHNLPETDDYGRLLEVLSSMDVQVFFGRGECFASSIAEAAGAGVPTVALATPLHDNGQAEQVQDGTTGFLVSDIAGAAERVRELNADRSKLAAMKRATQEHCLSRWHADRAAADLLSLYTFWLGRAAPPPYVQTMIAEANEFASTYGARMVATMSDGAVSQVKWRALLAAAENRRLWQVGRAIKRLVGR